MNLVIKYKGAWLNGEWLRFWIPFFKGMTHGWGMVIESVRSMTASIINSGYNSALPIPREGGYIMYQNISGQVLGASAVAGGIAVLPYTGNNPVLMVLPIVAIASGAIVVFSFIVTRFIKGVV